MTGYELVFITTPTLNEEDLTVVLKKFKKSLTESGGKLIHEYVWGRRRLAYEIEGNDFGVYHAWYFTGSGKTVDELQRQFGYSDDILRNQIVKTDDLDAEAAFLHNLIPPKEETVAKEEVQEVSTKTEKDGMVKAALDTLVAQGSLHSGDTVIITHGDSMETVGATNTMKIVTVA